MMRTGILVVAAFTLLPARVDLISSQSQLPGQMIPPQAMNLYANWKDGETWSRYIEATRESEIGLGLHPTGTGGTMLLAFFARWDGRTAKGAPKEIFAQAAIPPLLNPTVLRTASLSFVVNPGKKDMAVFDISGRLLVNDNSPGGIVLSGVGRVEQKEMVAIAQATALTGNIFNIEVTFNQAQRQAIKTFGQKIAGK
jgi:hypothetical protein